MVGLISEAGAAYVSTADVRVGVGGLMNRQQGR